MGKTHNLKPYKESWNLLMPVVEKMSRTTIDWENSDDRTDTYSPITFGMINSETGNLMVRFRGCPVFEAETLIEAVYIAVIDFLKNNMIYEK